MQLRLRSILVQVCEAEDVAILKVQIGIRKIKKNWKKPKLSLEISYLNKKIDKWVEVTQDIGKH